MDVLRAALALLAISALSACSCNPGVTNDDGATTVVDTGPPPQDTAPPPPCPTPEAEPNDTPDQANALPTERRGCGRFDEREDGADIDVFTFELDDNGWVLVEVEGDEGSVADTFFTLQNDEFAVNADDSPETSDVFMTFQANAGPYQLLVRDQQFNGGDRFTYRVLVSEIKEPSEYSLVEAAENDDATTAQTLATGDAVYGLMDAPAAALDEDWYRVVVPDDKHDVLIDVDAKELGSSADLRIEVLNDEQALLKRINDGGDAGRPDPDGVYESPGDELIYIRVLHQPQDPTEGPTHWYVLSVVLEEV